MILADKPKFNFWQWLGNYILATLKKEAVKKLMEKVFTGAKFVALKTWVATLIVDVLWDYVGEPLAKLAIRKGLFFYDVQVGKYKIKKIEEAKRSGDVEEYGRYITDV